MRLISSSALVTPFVYIDGYGIGLWRKTYKRVRVVTYKQFSLPKTFICNGT